MRELKEVVENPVPHPGCCFVLSTVHASKGLEYDRVIVMDVLDGLFPSVDVPVKENELAEEEQATLEEERRLFYVAVTRARYQLELLTYAGKFGESDGTKSTFVSQLLGETQRGMVLEKRKKVLAPYAAKPALDQIVTWEKEYQPGTTIAHKQFGRGVLESRSGSIAVIDFGENGIKKLDLPTCLKTGVIQKI
jgi:DNA helicase-2/ATP-dependent DNA helicase PcrA